MTPSKPSPPWYAPWRSAAAPAESEDAADLGTAFGLDLSLDPLADPRDETEAPRRDDRWIQHPGARRDSST